MTSLNFPSSPSDGDTFENYVYDGTRQVWRIQPNVPGISSTFKVSDTAPANPKNGEIWLNSTDGNTYIYYVDGDSAQWIEIGGNTGFPPDLDSLSGVTITSPTNGQALTYNGSEWVNATPASTLDSLTDTNITAPADGDLLVYDDGDWVNKVPTGSILQVVSTTKTDQFSTTSSSFQDITGLSVTITPSSTSSKILVIADVVLGNNNLLDESGSFWRLTGGNSSDYVGDAAGSRTRAVHGGTSNNGFHRIALARTATYLDSPNTTSAVTYKCQALSTNSSRTTLVNSNGTDLDSAEFGRYASSITVMEVAG